MNVALAPSIELGEAPVRSSPRTMRIAGLVSSMVLTVVAIAGLAYWDEQRESADALEDFAEEQTTVATSIASDLGGRLSRARRDALLIGQDPSSSAIPRALADDYLAISRTATPSPPRTPAAGDPFRLVVPLGERGVVELDLAPGDLLGGVGRIDRPGDRVLLVSPPDRPDLLTADGRALRAPRILDAVARGQTSITLTRDEAESLGLPRRIAVAGLGRVDAGALGHWSVAVVASAKRLRDREIHARNRLVLGVSLATALVAFAGFVILRRQRRELDYQRELALATLAAERDEDLARASKAATMGTLASGIAHEVSTPLAVIVGRAEQLVERLDGDDRSRKHAVTIVSEAERIGEIIGRFIDLARGMKPRLAPSEVTDFARGAVGLVEHRFAKAGVALVVDVRDDLPRVAGDPRLLEHVLVNLLLNACDASPRGASVHLRARADREASEIEIIVRDDGVGISAAAAARATEPFFTTKPEGAGLGLGLAIASEIVKEHHGQLRLQPRAGRGTEAIVRLPIASREPLS